MRNAPPALRLKHISSSAAVRQSPTLLPMSSTKNPPAKYSVTFVTLEASMVMLTGPVAWGQTGIGGGAGGGGQLKLLTMTGVDPVACELLLQPRPYRQLLGWYVNWLVVRGWSE